MKNVLWRAWRTPSAVPTIVISAANVPLIRIEDQDEEALELRARCVVKAVEAIALLRQAAPVISEQAERVSRDSELAKLADLVDELLAFVAREEPLAIDPEFEHHGC